MGALQKILRACVLEMTEQVPVSGHCGDLPTHGTWVTQAASARCRVVVLQSIQDLRIMAFICRLPNRPPSAGWLPSAAKTALLREARSPRVIKSHVAGTGRRKKRNNQQMRHSVRSKRS
jgi:hypothetical protein